MLKIERAYLLELDEQFLRRQRGWLWVLSLLLLLGGLSCLARPLISSEVLGSVIGVLLALSGLAMIIAMIISRRHNLWPMISGILLGAAYLLLGYVFIRNPAVGMLTLAIFLAALFAIGGIIRLIAGFSQCKSANGWSQVLLGVLDLVIAGMLISQGPVISIMLVTIIIGLEMLFTSFSLFVIARQISKTE